MVEWNPQGQENSNTKQTSARLKQQEHTDVCMTGKYATALPLVRQKPVKEGFQILISQRTCGITWLLVTTLCLCQVFSCCAVYLYVYCTAYI